LVTYDEASRNEGIERVRVRVGKEGESERVREWQQRGVAVVGGRASEGGVKVNRAPQEEVKERKRILPGQLEPNDSSAAPNH
jgi:hypothetical protein